MFLLGLKGGLVGLGLRGLIEGLGGGFTIGRLMVYRTGFIVFTGSVGGGKKRRKRFGQVCDM